MEIKSWRCDVCGNIPLPNRLFHQMSLYTKDHDGVRQEALFTDADLCDQCFNRPVAQLVSSVAQRRKYQPDTLSVGVNDV